MNDKPQVKVSEVLSLLKKGYTRYEKDNADNPAAKGSIQAHYGLTASAVKDVFQNEHLKGKKTILPKENPFILVDDLDGEDEEESTPVSDTEWTEVAEGSPELAGPVEERSQSN